jgi:RHS repeat-associated protein
MIRGGQTFRYVTDQVGSVRMLVNTATGAIAQRIDYDEFGNATADTAPGFQPFGFAGGLWDRDTGLVRFGARDYDPRIGRWVSKDPIGLAGGSNVFLYSRLDPINYFDPDGRNPILVAAGLAIVVGLNAAPIAVAITIGAAAVVYNTAFYAATVCYLNPVYCSFATNMVADGIGIGLPPGAGPSLPDLGDMAYEVANRSSKAASAYRRGSSRAVLSADTQALLWSLSPNSGIPDSGSCPVTPGGSSLPVDRIPDNSGGI